MSRNTAQHTLLASTNTSAVGTALNVSRVEAWNAQVNITGNSASAVTIVIEGSIDGSTYGIINSTTRTNDNTSYFVNAALTPYKQIRAYTVTHATTAAVEVLGRLLG